MGDGGGGVVLDGELVDGGPEWEFGGTGDYNTDGVIDIVWRNHTTVGRPSVSVPRRLAPDETSISSRPGDRAAF